MKQVISVKDLQDMVRAGKDVGSLPSEALLTPSARDFLRELAGPAAFKSSSSNGTAPSTVKPVTSKSSQEEIITFFNSPPIEELKRQICDIGRRLWQREYVDGNGGNLAIRVADDIALCTPTLDVANL